MAKNGLVNYFMGRPQVGQPKPKQRQQVNSQQVKLRNQPQNVNALLKNKQPSYKQRPVDPDYRTTKQAYEYSVSPFPS